MSFSLRFSWIYVFGSKADRLLYTAHLGTRHSRKRGDTYEMRYDLFRNNKSLLI